MVRELLNLTPEITFIKGIEAEDFRVCTFPNASFKQSPAKDCDQSGVITGLANVRRNVPGIRHLVDWNGPKKRVVCNSPSAAEIIGAEKCDNRCFYFKETINGMFMKKLESELFVDLICVFDTIISFHAVKDYRLRPTVYRFRQSFEAKEVKHMR